MLRRPEPGMRLAHKDGLTCAAPASALSVYMPAGYARAPGCQAAHLQPDHGEIVGIVFHREFREEDVAKVRDVNHVTERLRGRRNLNRLPVRSFHADVFDLDMFYQ